MKVFACLMRNIVKKLKINQLLGETLQQSLAIEKKFIKTGSFLFDLALGGGILQGRIINIMGDPSAGKTLECLSIIQQFLEQYPEGIAYFNDAESALDPFWAKHTFKLDETRVRLPNSETVEHFFDSVKEAINKSKKDKQPFIYILDSLDALKTERTIVVRKDTTDSMRDKLDKASVMRQKIPSILKGLQLTNSILIVISQSTAKIGVLFGDKSDITGGSAIKFYSSQRIKTAEKGKIKDKKNRIIGVLLKVKTIKNKVAIPFREAEFPVYFAYGIDDTESCVNFILENSSIFGKKKSLCYKNKTFKSKKELIDYFRQQKNSKLEKLVLKVWKSIYNTEE